MNDKQFGALFMAQLLPAMQSAPGLSGVKLARSFQSRQQGASSAPYVYFFKVADKRFGHPERREDYNATAGNFTHTETQRYETTFQFSAWIPQDPKDTTGLTESDILNTVSSIIQSDAIRASFWASEVGILRVTDVRNPYITDDHDQFAAVPTFDVVLTHKRFLVATTPAVVTSEFNFGRV